MDRKTILVTGLHGFIGTRFAQRITPNYRIIDLNRRGVKLDHKFVTDVIQADITDEHDVYMAVDRKDIDAVVHFAAKAHIDRCEDDKRFGKQGETWQVNVVGTRNLAKACAHFGKLLINLSTECIFNGEDGNYTETDSPNPVNWYGMTKLQAEYEIQRITTQYCIIRSVLAYGHINQFPSDIAQFFLKRIVNKEKFSAVNDQYLSFTFVDDLVDTIFLVIEKKLTGIFHYAGNLSVSPYQFASMLQKYVKNSNDIVESVSLNEYFGVRSHLRLRNATLISEKISNILKIRSSNLTTAIPLLVQRFSEGL